MDIDIPTWSDVVKWAPIAAIVCSVVYFGWWLRGHQVRDLRSEVEALREIVRKLVEDLRRKL